MELDANAELDPIECSEVSDAELVGGTDLGSGHGMRMERGRDGRREFGRRAGSLGRGGTGEQRRQSPSCERGATRASGVLPTLAGGANERHRQSPSEQGRCGQAELSRE
jgi:hypothetical protein